MSEPGAVERWMEKYVEWRGTMSLSDELAAAEARVREAVDSAEETWAKARDKYNKVYAARFLGATQAEIDDAANMIPPAAVAIGTALDRYAAVCKLAGRARAHMTPDEVDDMRRELAQLTRDTATPATGA